MAKKKKPKNKIPSKKWEKYSITSDKIERKKHCPRCGLGVFMAKHSNRWTCGACHYCEFITNK